VTRPSERIRIKVEAIKLPRVCWSTLRAVFSVTTPSLFFAAGRSKRQFSDRGSQGTGRVKKKVHPSPFLDSTQTLPPWRSIILFDSANPTPVPSYSSGV
jgi:hypothetical protein